MKTSPEIDRMRCEVNTPPYIQRGHHMCTPHRTQEGLGSAKHPSTQSCGQGRGGARAHACTRAYPEAGTFRVYFTPVQYSSTVRSTVVFENHVFWLGLLLHAGVRKRCFKTQPKGESRIDELTEWPTVRTHLLEELDESEAAAPLRAVVAVDGHALDHAELGEVRRELLLRDVHGVLALSQAADEHLCVVSCFRGAGGECSVSVFNSCAAGLLYCCILPVFPCKNQRGRNDANLGITPSAGHENKKKRRVESKLRKVPLRPPNKPRKTGLIDFCCTTR